MKPTSPAGIGAYYDQLLATHGDTALGAGWPNEADRQLRFGVMRDLGWQGAPLRSVCDLACGTGAFLRYLQAQGAVPETYLGIDLSQAAIDIAQKAHPKADFICADILSAPPAQRFDYVIANGLFTVRDTVNEADMWAFMTEMATAMWAMADKGIAFNLMSAVVDWQRDDLFHVEIDRLLGFLYPLAGRHVVIRADYGLYEYTVYVYRAPPALR
ncbi:MAG: class I SAM-dependent methyltransferase [Rhodobacteraceae bacterium]|nr:class I SAM-dependent methyltransferase [Paracoccaceae bacterium]